MVRRTALGPSQRRFEPCIPDWRPLLQPSPLDAIGAAAFLALELKVEWAVRRGNMKTVSQLLSVRDRMLLTFNSAAQERPKRQEFVPVVGGRGTELGWIAYERETMLLAVNQERLARGLEPVTVAQFTKVENLAVGHSDYDTKLSLYCAELALGFRTP